MGGASDGVDSLNTHTDNRDTLIRLQLLTKFSQCLETLSAHIIKDMFKQLRPLPRVPQSGFYIKTHVPHPDVPPQSV